MVAKSFPRKQVLIKIFKQKFFAAIFLWLQNHFLENRFEQNIFIKHVPVQNVLWLQNRFLENRFEQKSFIKKFAKSFPRKQVWTKNFHQQFFGPKFFIVPKTFPRKQVLTKNIHENFLVENFLWLQNLFLEAGLN